MPSVMRNVGKEALMRRDKQNGENLRTSRYSEQRLSKLLKAAQIDASELSDLADFIQFHSLPDNVKTKCFNIFNRHIQDPLGVHPFEESSFQLVIFSLSGIEHLEASYFKGREEKLLKVWPRILGWSRSTLARDELYGHDEFFFETMGGVFTVVNHACKELLLKDDSFDLAVKLWNGRTSQDGNVYYSVSPLLTCLITKNKEENGVWIRTLMADYSSPEQLTRKFLSRMKQAVLRSSPVETLTACRLAGFMEVLETFRRESKTLDTSFLSCSMGATMVIYVNVFIGASDFGADSDPAKAASLCCRLIFRCLRLQSKWARRILRAGVLETMLKLAVHEDSFASEVLEGLCRCLINEDVIFIARERLCDLYTDEARTEESLKACSTKFRQAWGVFENAVLEHAALLELFVRGYGIELGECANLACKKMGTRSDFQKCAGCGFALYCAKSCQEKDWTAHRVHCKKFSGKSSGISEDKINRFARRLAIFQVNRHLLEISYFARTQDKPYLDSAIRVDFREFPFTINTVDYREFLDESRHTPNFVLAAYEIHRLVHPEDKINHRMLLLCSEGDEFIERPFVVRLATVWKEGLTIPVPLGVDGVGSKYKTENGWAYMCTEMDALRAVVRFAYQIAVDKGKPRWSEEVIGEAVDMVIHEFDDAFKRLGMAWADEDEDETGCGDDGQDGDDESYKDT